MCEFTATLLGKRLYWGKVPFPFRTDSAGRKGTDTPRGETLSVSPSPKSPVDALESSAATATLPSYYILLLNWSSFVFLSLVRACLSHPFFTFLSLVSYPSLLLTTHVCLFLLSQDPPHLLPSDRIHEIRAFPFVFFPLIKRDPIQ